MKSQISFETVKSLSGSLTSEASPGTRWRLIGCHTVYSAALNSGTQTIVGVIFLAGEQLHHIDGAQVARRVDHHAGIRPYVPAEFADRTVGTGARGINSVRTPRP
jgi:hypothetical protein